MRKTLSKFRKNQVFGKWELVRFLAVGGNGEVWLAKNNEKGTETVAIKFLKKIKPVAYSRFRSEVDVVQRNSDIKGVLQIIDSYLPEKSAADSTPWYVMPVAIPLKDYLKDKTAEDIIKAVISIAQTLNELHKRNISHRDIKPANLFFRDDTFYVNDFGLVDYPGKDDLTMKGADLGPKWTIAPEMRRSPESADGKLADVYSLAKTLWILLTKKGMGFEGQYSNNPSIELKTYLSDIYLAPLDELLNKCTDHEPTKRPSMEYVCAELEKWIDLNRDFEKKTKSAWKNIQIKLFPTSIPKRVIWENIEDIISVLNIIGADGQTNQTNHTLFPDVGGLDLTQARASFEKGCIEIKFDAYVYIIKPKRLLFESFSNNFDWNYFRLETGELSSIINSESSAIKEAFTELKPGVYTDPDCWVFNDFNGERLPAEARFIIRMLRGVFLICLKTSVYNSIPGTYDGRHNRMTAEEFRDYIERAIKSSNNENVKAVQSGNSNIKKTKYIKSTKERKGSRFLGADEIEIIKKIISLAKASDNETKVLRKKYGLEGGVINFFDENFRASFMKYEEEDKPKEKELEEFLKRLTYDELVIISATMDGGREKLINGRAHPLDEKLDDFENESAEDLIRSILEKADVDVYLSSGLEVYSKNSNQ